jgi:hypothetical protein
MAKELPYFKFEPNQWENGNIQMFSHELKGVFMDLCSMYWSRLGDLPYKLAVGKICNGNATALDLLYEENIFAIKDGFICIDFLNEQLLEFENTSKINSENARIGWEKRRKNATALKSQSDPNAIREDKSKEDKIKKDINIRKQEFKNSLFPFLDIYSKEMLKDFFDYWSEHGEKDRKFRKEKEKSFNLDLRLKTWLKRSKEFKEKNVSQKKEKINAGTLIQQVIKQNNGLS